MVKNGRLKLAGIIIAGITTISGGTIGYRILETKQDNTTNELNAIQNRHDRDINDQRMQVTALNALIDVLIAKLSSTESKVDMLIEIVRDQAIRNKE